MPSETFPLCALRESCVVCARFSVGNSSWEKGTGALVLVPLAVPPPLETSSLRNLRHRRQLDLRKTKTYVLSLSHLHWYAGTLVNRVLENQLDPVRTDWTWPPRHSQDALLTWFQHLQSSSTGPMFQMWFDLAHKNACKYNQYVP